MYRCVVIAFVLVNQTLAVPPLRFTIDCSEEKDDPYGLLFRSSGYKSKQNLNINSFCNLIQNAIPEGVEGGKFILIEPDSDQEGYGNSPVPISIAPPVNMIPALTIPKLKGPRLRIPKLDVPTLREQISPLKAPRVGKPMKFSAIMKPSEESSVERMERFKKGVHKMLHFVKVLSQIDQYLSERTRIIVDKLTKTFAE